LGLENEKLFLTITAFLFNFEEPLLTLKRVDLNCISFRAKTSPRATVKMGSQKIKSHLFHFIKFSFYGE